MSKLKITILPLEQIAAYVSDSLVRQLEAKPDAVLGMTTGTTPLTTGIYEEWVRRERLGVLDFSRAVLINPDEQIGIAPEHPESYYSYMKHHFLDRLSRSPGEWHIPIGTAADPEAECRKLEQTINSYGGVDWQLMGLGMNGHICFIEPGAAIPAQCYITPIAEESRELYAPLFGSLQAVPTHAITYGIGTALACKTIKMVVVGGKKAGILAKVMTHPVTSELPATFLQLHANVEFVIDPAAAAQLPSNIDEYAEVTRTDRGEGAM
ncbi:MAG: glucosamine-6-phosphate deaminase [Paenibacillus sp.]|jgi:glucosamine-6-phosphate deaminase|nr:glucosamine-6-phosphate deaminase [Paenibacillus sp.]